jgi:peptide/nickel transport system substrate-binding protein
LPPQRLARRKLLIGFGLAGLGGILGACAPAAPATPTTGNSATATAKLTEGPKPTAASAATKPSLQPVTPAPSAGQATAPAAATKPAASTATGASGGTLKLLYWQAPTILNPHLAPGTKDYHAARIALEPLMTIDADGKFVPVLAAEVPSRQNGGLAEDGKSVTYKLKKDVKWADGKPFTADDVVFTWQFVTNKETGSTNQGVYGPIEKAEALDPTTVKLTFKEATPGWYVPFVGQTGMVLPKHALAEYVGPKAKDAPFNLKAFGTGPYIVESFKPGDLVVYARNPNYRQPGKPAFDRVEIKGGGDAASAARAVFQTGEYDYAWNLQVEWPVLQEIEKGGKGSLVTAPGGGLELLLLNQTDPGQEIEGEKSSLKAPHPFLADAKVREALALAIDRETMAKQLYGAIGEPAANVLTTPSDMLSKSNRIEFDLARANKLLDDAGYKKGADGVRATPDGKRMKVLLQTAQNSLRQKQQVLVKDGWGKIGVEVELKTIDSSVFFGSPNGGSTETISHFYADVEMASSRNGSPFPSSHMKQWYSGRPERDVAQKANSWSGANLYRWISPEYNQLYDQALAELDVQKSRELWVKLNDLVVQSRVAIPLVERRNVSGATKGLKGPQLLPFDVDTWNIAEWTK